MTICCPVANAALEQLQPLPTTEVNHAEELFHVLVVAADAESTGQTRRILIREGYVVSSAGTGMQALQTVRSTRPDLVLLDGDLPDVDSAEVCRWIKSDPALADIFVVIVFAAPATDRDQSEGLALGADGCIARPIGHRELAAQVEGFVRLLCLNRELRLQADELRAKTAELENVRLQLRQVMAEQQQSEAMRVETEALLQAAMDQNPAGIAIADAPSGRLRYVNRMGLQIRGTSAAEAMAGVEVQNYAATWQLFHLDGTPLAPAEVPLARAVLNGETCSKELIIRRPDNEERIVQAEASPIRDLAGEIQAGMVFFLDITERKRVENQLRLLARAVDQTPVVVMITDARGNLEYANQQFTKLTGYSLDEVKGLNPRFLKSGQTPAPAYQELWAAVMSGREWAGTFCNRKKNGELFWEEARIAPVFDAAGHIAHCIAFKLDITERRHIEDHLRSQARLLDLARDAIMVSNAAGQLQYGNQALAQLTGWPVAETAGRGLAEVLGCDAKKTDTAFHAARTNGEWSGELAGISRSGRKFTVLSRWSWVPAHDEIKESILSINTDITEQKQIQAQFLRVQRVESVGALANGIAHDLNNIISPIILCANLLKNELTTDESRHMLGMVEKSAKRAADIVKQLLSFSRGKDEQKVPIQFRHLAREMGKIVTETFPASIRFESSYADNLWPVLGNATQLHQVLLNLCVNARDAMPQGGRILLTIENIRLDDGFAAQHAEAKVGSFLRVSLADTGQGIPEAIQGQIFEPFFTTKLDGKGTGLGLATVQYIIRGHGGYITFTSQAGQGTTFEFYLPALPEMAHELTEPDGAELDPVAKGSGELVLLVDDEQPIRNALAKALRRKGYEVMEAANGIEALKQFNFAGQRVRLVVADLSMPVMDGALLCQSLRDQSPTTPIIICSGGFSGPAALSHFQTLAKLGITDILYKPHTAEVLLKKMEEILHPVAAQGITSEH
jgi:nitrogen fixation negative regulator NifL